MLSTDYIDDAFEMIRKKRDAPKFDTDRPQKRRPLKLFAPVTEPKQERNEGRAKHHA